MDNMGIFQNCTPKTLEQEHLPKKQVQMIMNEGFPKWIFIEGGRERVQIIVYEMFHYILISVSIMGTCYENYIEGI
jgi:hypothetical protein